MVPITLLQCSIYTKIMLLAMAIIIVVSKLQIRTYVLCEESREGIFTFIQVTVKESGYCYKILW